MGIPRLQGNKIAKSKTMKADEAKLTKKKRADMKDVARAY